MRFYNQQHRFYCGVDLHARTMYLCILDEVGQVVYDKNLAADPDAFLKAIAPFQNASDFAVRPIDMEAMKCARHGIEAAYVVLAKARQRLERR
jgi:hypothetical protein